MACTATVFLKNCCCMGCNLGNVCFYPFAARANDDAEIFTFKSADCMENVSKQSAPRNFMEHLGRCGFHSRAFSSGENDHCFKAHV